VFSSKFSVLKALFEIGQTMVLVQQEDLLWILCVTSLWIL